MNEETKALVEAITYLKQDSSHFKDYVFPFVTGLFSSLLGAGVAYWTIKHQDENLIQKGRIQSVNDWVLSVEGAMQALISIKQNYHGKLSDNPYERAMVVRSLLGDKRKFEKRIADLAFIVPLRGKPETNEIKWRQIPRIRALVENYNRIIDIWNKRVEVDRPIKEKLTRDYGELAYVDVNIKQIFDSVGAAEFVLLIDLTERAIKLTDDIIAELNDFLQGFPEVAKVLISEKDRDRYGPILTFNTGGNERLENMLEKCTEVNYSILSQVFGESEDGIRAEYETGYEEQKN